MEQEREEPAAGRRRAMPSLATQVLIGLGVGIAAGIFFGEAVRPLQIVGDAFVRLLQMTVVPYITFSLIAGLGRLEPRDAVALALRGGAVLLALWGVTLALVAAMPLAFPDIESASFFSQALVEETPPVDFLSLYIPANPFHDLSNAVIPAVVLFSIVLGVAVMGIERKRLVLDPLDVVVDLLTRVTAWVARLAPIGVLALAAVAAGTMSVRELERLQVYIFCYSGLALLLTLLVVPGIVAALTPLRHRDVLGAARDALVTAFATANALIVLPILAARAKEMAETRGVSEHDASTIDVMAPTAFNFPSCGKLLSLAFLPFAGWFVGSPLGPSDLPVLIGAGVPSFFGQTAMAVPFMLDLLRLPADLFSVFLTLDVIVSRFGVLLAATHILALSLIAPFAIRRGFALRWRALARVIVLGVALSVALLAGARVLFGALLRDSEPPYRSFIQMDLRSEPVPWKIVAPQPPAEPPTRGHRLEAIRRRGMLRVGFFRDRLPFAFVNEAGRLVGYDVDVAHQLARALGARLEFVRLEEGEKFRALDRGTCDLLIGGLAVTPERARRAALSRPYIDHTLAFLVPDPQRHDFALWEDIRARRRLRIGVPGLRHLDEMVRDGLPEAELVPVESPRPFLRGAAPDLDAVVIGAEAGSAWTMVYPSFSVVVPRPHPVRIPAAYLLPRGEDAWRDFVDAWLELKSRDGTLDALFDHWIRGRAAKRKEPRWSVIRNVLGWVD